MVVSGAPGRRLTYGAGAKSGVSVLDKDADVGAEVEAALAGEGSAAEDEGRAADEVPDGFAKSSGPAPEKSAAGVAGGSPIEAALLLAMAGAATNTTASMLTVQMNERLQAGPTRQEEDHRLKPVPLRLSKRPRVLMLHDASLVEQLAQMRAD